MNVLVIGAHPDDELLGVGGTIVRHLEQGDRVSVLLLTDGHNSRTRDAARAREVSPQVLARRKSARAACELLGISDLQMLPYPDQRLDTVPIVEIVQEIERAMAPAPPDIVYTHHGGDVNSDHRVTFEATLTATRPVGQRYPARVLCYETISSTEWGAPFPDKLFCPNVFVDISSALDLKLKAIECYRQELRPDPHPRSLRGIALAARRWGGVISVEAAEAFMLVRDVWKRG